MVRKILNYVKTTRFLDIFCYVFCGIYLVFAISVACLNVSIVKNQEQDFNNLMAYVNSVNKKLENEFSIKNDSSSSSTPEIDYPVFKDGKTALLSAYEKFYNSNSFVAKINGTMSTSAMGINLTVNYSMNSVKYNKDKAYNELLVKYLEASSMQSQIEQVVQCGKQTYIENGSIRQRETLHVKRENNVLKGTQWGEITNVDKSYPVCNNLMIINNETIDKISYFKVKEKNGKPQYYYVQAVLNTSTAPVDFKNVVAFNIGKMGFTAPNYTQCKVTACIDASGTLIGLTCQDVGKVSITGPVVGGMTVTCNYNYNWAISGINQQINYVPEDF